jgi:PAS domain S-box-containing protein
MVRNTRREFLGDVGRGMLLAGLGTTLAGDLGLALSAIDAREARRAQSAALQESETRLRAIFDQSSIGIAICTLSGQIQRINPALERMLGYSEAEMQRMTFRAVTPEPDLAREEPLFRALAAGERESYSLEKRFFRKDHRVVWGELTVSIVREGTTPLFVLAMARDVTDRRALQEQLDPNDHGNRDFPVANCEGSNPAPNHDTKRSGASWCRPRLFQM